jgi:nucleoside-diphosphate-sugar epimerase
MKILVTGHEGFIGTNLTFALRMLGHEVIGIDKKTGKDIIKSYDLDLDGVQFVYHLAANLFDKFFENYEATNSLMDRLDKDVPVVFTSSAAVYGDVYGEGSKEEENTSPANDYGYFKIMEEGEVARHGKHWIFRLANVYGENSTHGIIYKYVRGERVLNNNGLSVRDFIYVRDVVRAMVQVLTDDIKPGIYNLSTGKGYAIVDIYKRFFPDLIAESTPLVEEIKVSILNNEKFVEEFGWKPTEL